MTFVTDSPAKGTEILFAWASCWVFPPADSSPFPSLTEGSPFEAPEEIPVRPKDIKRQVKNRTHKTVKVFFLVIFCSLLKECSVISSDIFSYLLSIFCAGETKGLQRKPLRLFK